MSQGVTLAECRRQGDDVEQGTKAIRSGLALTSLGFAFAVAAVAVLETVLASKGPAVPLLWWPAFAVFCVTLLWVQGFIPRPRWLRRNVLLLGLIATAVVLVLLFADQGSAALLFVLTSSIASFFWPWRAVAVVATAQTCVVLVAGLLGGWPVADVVATVMVIGAAQVFGTLVVYVARCEEDARHALAIAHAELRSVTAMLELSTREAERVRIARELHDLAGHHLTALSLELEVASHLTSTGVEGEHVQRAQRMAKQLLAEIRSVVTEMRQATPTLEPVLREIADGVPGLTISVDVDERAQLSLAHGVTLIRCVQESITNAIRHGGAKSVEIRAVADASGVRFWIADDGVGVERIEPGNGLTGMRERIEMLDGTLEVTSRMGAGFQLAAYLPKESSAVHRAPLMDAR